MPDMGGGGWTGRWAGPSRRVAVLLAGALLFAGLLTLSLALEGFDDLTFLYVLPITIVAIELGFLGGVAAGILALGLFVVFALAEPSYHPGAVDEVSRSVAFLVLGGVTGALGHHLQLLDPEIVGRLHLGENFLDGARAGIASRLAERNRRRLIVDHINRVLR